MKKAIKLLAALATVIFISSFSEINSLAPIGTYGVSESNPNQILLKINPDQTFYFQDYSNPDQKIIVKGTWTLKRKNLVLNSDHPEMKFHKVWTLVENGQAVKSRKGFTFYRLSKIDE
jgi:hypothetical protein